MSLQQPSAKSAARGDKQQLSAKCVASAFARSVRLSLVRSVGKNLIVRPVPI
jgi:hypothetical protein